MNPPAHLSALQWDVLWTLSKRGALSGIGIREELVDYYGEDVSYGEVYPNLDALVDFGLVTRREGDHHTSEFKLTEEGRHTLARRQVWQEGLGTSINGP